jgi:hypothetical protein
LLQDAKEIWKNEQVVFEKLTFDPLLWLTHFLIRHSTNSKFPWHSQDVFARFSANQWLLRLKMTP